MAVFLTLQPISRSIASVPNLKRLKKGAWQRTKQVENLIKCLGTSVKQGRYLSLVEVPSKRIARCAFIRRKQNLLFVRIINRKG
jgi:hypothetical protein